MLIDVAPGVDFDSTWRVRSFISELGPARELETVVEAAMRVHPRANRASVAYRDGSCAADAAGCSPRPPPNAWSRAFRTASSRSCRTLDITSKRTIRAH
ncbi:hypothetical protein [Nonomuraea dietziae]|uniref:hypothetical protein n=1 Tax=Nonomuraea dietziae TaxID=65515 RepID=UPI0033D4D870